MAVCRVPWCVFDAVEGGPCCVIHEKRPAYHDEKAEQWRKRIADEDRAAKHAAKRAEDDAKEAEKRAQEAHHG